MVLDKMSHLNNHAPEDKIHHVMKIGGGRGQKERGGGSMHNMYFNVHWGERGRERERERAREGVREGVEREMEREKERRDGGENAQ